MNVRFFGEIIRARRGAAHALIVSQHPLVSCAACSIGLCLVRHSSPLSCCAEAFYLPASRCPLAYGGGNMATEGVCIQKIKSVWRRPLVESKEKETDWIVFSLHSVSRWMSPLNELVCLNWVHQLKQADGLERNRAFWMRPPDLCQLGAECVCVWQNQWWWWGGSRGLGRLMLTPRSNAAPRSLSLRCVCCSR